MSEEKKLNGTVIVTYRCNARCSMCNRYKAPSKPEEEISIETIKKLPKMYFTNITGGEPFIRTDLKDIVRELYKKSDRIVISTNGFFTDRIVDLCKEFPQIGIRISIEGLEQTNNEIRGLQNGYQRGYGTLKKLREMGMKDVGFGMTVQDKNAVRYEKVSYDEVLIKNLKVMDAAAIALARENGLSIVVYYILSVCLSQFKTHILIIVYLY